MVPPLAGWLVVQVIKSHHHHHRSDGGDAIIAPLWGNE